MYSTDVFRGKIYQGFLPTPVWPAFAPDVRRAFGELDRELAIEAGTQADREALVKALVHDRSDREERSPGVLEALDHALGLRRIGRGDLLDVNARVVGYPATGFRQTPIWIGGPGPDTAWHIGSPVDQLPKLVNSVLEHAVRDDLPASLRAMVALMRLLQIHPFRDGNGRTARVFAYWVMVRSLGPSPRIAGILASLWRRHEFDLHSVSVAIRDTGDWRPYFDRVLARSMQTDNE